MTTRPQAAEISRSSATALRSCARHFTHFLQWQFSKHPPGAYFWSPDEVDNEIHISGDAPIDPVKIGQRPALTVLRGHAAWNGMGLNDQAFVDLRTGAKAYMDIVPTTIIINALSRVDVEAEALAEHCAHLIRVYREAIISASQGLILYCGQRVAISPPSPPGSLVGGDSPDGEWSVSVVSVPVYLQTLDSRWPLNKPILRTIGARLRAHGRPSRPPAVVQLQGTAVNQPQNEVSVAQDSGGDLPQSSRTEAPSTEPLEVNIKT